MKLSLILFLIFSKLFWGHLSIAWAQDFQQAFQSYKSGDYVTSSREWRKLAEQGDARAQFFLGYSYIEEIGVPQLYEEAVWWYAKAAEQGHPEAQHNLATMYYSGLGVSQDYRRAAKWFLAAAEQGLAEAQHNLGTMHGTGKGMSENNLIAYMWYTIAASNGYQVAEDNLKTLALKLNSTQILKAKQLAEECIDKKYKGC